mmetsp:Transcript_94578/g.276403  ORF Transcript_94578/g.276403 Transcript_94578/m.276403 type:complete len:282 (-) Transcript_94578:4000-4845(-)
MRLLAGLNPPCNWSSSPLSQQICLWNWVCIFGVCLFLRIVAASPALGNLHLHVVDQEQPVLDDLLLDGKALPLRPPQLAHTVLFHRLAERRRLGHCRRGVHLALVALERLVVHQPRLIVLLADHDDERIGDGVARQEEGCKGVDQPQIDEVDVLIGLLEANVIPNPVRRAPLPTEALIDPIVPLGLVADCKPDEQTVPKKEDHVVVQEEVVDNMHQPRYLHLPMQSIHHGQSSHDHRPACKDEEAGEEAPVGNELVVYIVQGPRHRRVDPREEIAEVSRDS